MPGQLRPDAGLPPADPASRIALTLAGRPRPRAHIQPAGLRRHLRGADRARGHGAGQGRAAAHRQRVQPVHLHAAERHAQRRLRLERRHRTSTTIRLVVHGDVYSPAKRADYRRSHCRRGRRARQAPISPRAAWWPPSCRTTTRMVVAQRKLANAQAEPAGGRSSSWTSPRSRSAAAKSPTADVVKAQIQLEQRQRDLQERAARPGQGAHRLRRSALPGLTARSSPWSTIWKLRVALPPFPDIQALAARNNPDIRAAQATVSSRAMRSASARAELSCPRSPSTTSTASMPTSSPFTIPKGNNLLGSAVQAQVTSRSGTGARRAARSGRRNCGLQQAQERPEPDAAAALWANLNSFYLEAQIAADRRWLPCAARWTSPPRACG